MKRRILAIDISTKTGFCWNDGPRYETLAFEKHDDKFAIQLYHKIMSLVKDLQPDVAIIEDYAFGARSSSVSVLAELGGVVKLALDLCSIRRVSITSTQWKLYCLGDGHIPKENIKLAILKKFKEDFSDKTQDEADAFCILKTAELCLQDSISSRWIKHKGFLKLRSEMRGE